MKKYALLLFVPLLGLAACQPEPPPPPPPPQTVEVIGVVREAAGACATIVGDNGVAYAVRPEALPPEAMPGTRVRVIGVMAPQQTCPGRTLLDVSGQIVVMEARRPGRRGYMPPK